MKKTLLSLLLGLLSISAVHAQQTVVIERHGIFTDLASAVGAFVALPLAAVEGIVVGTVEAAGSLIQGSTRIIVTHPTTIVPAPAIIARPQVVTVPASPAPVVVPRTPAVIPMTTIVTTHDDGTVTTVTRQASAYELGPVILTPVDPSHRAGPSPHVNPYVYRYR